MWAGLSVAG
ncbi:unnamed protein product [Linum tenue]|uniref:Uncharacterized protein n=1 Tax=Linum tenue TaxID=586396 RepID=A0AAV0QJB3_9ROSI|nr:unnamed protein product [Linum tenue]